MNKPKRRIARNIRNGMTRANFGLVRLVAYPSPAVTSHLQRKYSQYTRV
jgi:hypothetical protein